MTDSSLLDGAAEIEFVLCDLDGVVWLAHEPIAGAPEAIERLRASGRRVVFVTNNSVSTMDEHEAALEAIGVPASGDVLSSAQAAASLVGRRDRVMVCGGRGVVEAVAARGAELVPIETSGDPDVVLVGLDRSFDFARLSATSAVIRAGARFVATNDDATFPTPAGFTPGAGSIVSAVATAAGAEPVLAGKPHAPMAELVRHTCGPRWSADRAIVVGDRWSTDGAFARELGCRFALVRSGVTAPSMDPDGHVDLDEPDLAALAARILGT